jgi:hypothetical protein
MQTEAQLGQQQFTLIATNRWVRYEGVEESGWWRSRVLWSDCVDSVMKLQIPFKREISCPAGHYKFSRRSNARKLTNLLVSLSVIHSVIQVFVFVCLFVCLFV